MFWQGPPGGPSPHFRKQEAVAFQRRGPKDPGVSRPGAQEPTCQGLQGSGSFLFHPWLAHQPPHPLLRPGLRPSPAWAACLSFPHAPRLLPWQGQQLCFQGTPSICPLLSTSTPRPRPPGFLLTTASASLASLLPLITPNPKGEALLKIHWWLPTAPRTKPFHGQETLHDLKPICPLASPRGLSPHLLISSPQRRLFALQHSRLRPLHPLLLCSSSPFEASLTSHPCGPPHNALQAILAPPHGPLSHCPLPCFTSFLALLEETLFAH